MKAFLFSLPLIPLVGAGAFAGEDAVRSSAYSAGLEQAEIHAESGAVAADLQSVLAEMEANGLGGAAGGLAAGAREGLMKTMEGSLLSALAHLREASESGDPSALEKALRVQGEAEVALRTVSSRMGHAGGGSEALLLAKALVARQTRAMRLPRDTEGAAILLEQQAIALQVQDLMGLLYGATGEGESAPPEILAKAAEVAVAIQLPEKAARAAEPGGAKPKNQEAVREALLKVRDWIFLSKPSSERLRELLGRAEALREAVRGAGKAPGEKASGELAGEAGELAGAARIDSPPSSEQFRKASDLLAKAAGQEGSAQAAEQALSEAVKSLSASLARAEAAEKSTLAEASRELRELADRAASLAAAQEALAGSANPSPEAQERVRNGADQLKAAAASPAPKAASELDDAAKKMAGGDAEGAAKEMKKAADSLARQAAAAAAAAEEDAQMAAAQGALQQAVEANRAAQATMEAGKAGEAAAQAMGNREALDAMAASAAMAAAKSAAGSPGAAGAMKAASKAAREASGDTLAAAQNASRQQMPGAKQANRQAGEKLSRAAAAIGRQRESLRAQAGLPPPKREEFASGENPEKPSQGGSSTWKSEDLADTSGLRFARHAALDKGERAAMAELRKTGVPQEFSGAVEKYFESLAAAP